jgi:hypothetical protein
MHQQGILLAQRQGLDHGIYQRLHDMPTEQKPDTLHQNPNVPNPINHQHQTILSHRHRSHHWSTQK